MQTCVKYTSTRQVLLPLVKPLADRGAGSSWACWGALTNHPTHLVMDCITPALSGYVNIFKSIQIVQN